MAPSTRSYQGRPLNTPALPREATNGITVRVDGEALFVTDGEAGRPNYCGSPLTGAIRVRLPASAHDVEAVTATRVYYLGPSTWADLGGALMSAAIPAACR